MLLRARLDLNHALHQGLSVWLLQDRQEHPVAYETGQRAPVDVEEVCRGTRWTLTKDLAPERVALGIGGHVIRHDVEHHAHVVDAQGVGEPAPGGLTAQFPIDAAVINDVVAVRAARARGVNRREIHMADTQLRHGTEPERQGRRA